jgi:hypothetical protein
MMVIDEERDRSNSTNKKVQTKRSARGQLPSKGKLHFQSIFQ